MKARRLSSVTKPLKVAGLFAGIGGIELGLARSGHRTSMLCELDPAAAAVLKQRFPRVSKVLDVRDVDRLPEGTTLLTAGFPCQDLSSSGNKVGIGGSRSSLVDHVFRILERNQVDWVLIENVKFMLHLHGGKAMARIASQFEAMGYSWAYRVLNTRAFGVPQRRHRVFFLASRVGDPRDVLLSEDNPLEENQPVLGAPLGFYWTEGTYATGLAANSIPPLKGGSTIGIPSAPAILRVDGFVGTPSLHDAERLQGFPAGWTEGAENVVRSTFRWKLIGNAVSVPVAEWIGRKLIQPAPYDWSRDEAMGVKWPDAAWSIGGRRYRSDVSDSPLGIRGAGLDGFIAEPMKPLSRKAVEGFLSRARAGNLRYPEGFLSALQSYRDRVSA